MLIFKFDLLEREDVRDDGKIFLSRFSVCRRQMFNWWFV